MTATAEASQALERAAATPRQKTVLDLIERQKPAIEKALPQAIGVERFVRIVQTELRRLPKLYDCSAESLLAAMMLSAQLGLEPGPLGHVYLVPFKGQATWIIGYKGMIELAYRSGRVKEIAARTVYDAEEFDCYESDAGTKLRHRPLPPAERGTERCWYARARLTSGGSVIRVVWPEEIEATIKRSPAARKGEGPWVTDRDAMCQKTAVRRLQPYLPQSPVLAEALSYDGRALALDPIGGDVEAVVIDADAEEVEF